MIGKGKTRAVPQIAAASALLVLIAVTAGCNWGTNPDDEKKDVFALRFFPSTVEMEGADDIATVEVKVDNASSLVAVHFLVSYDPAIVEITKVHTNGLGLLFTDDSAEVQEIESSIDNDIGLVKVGVGAVRAGYEGASGSGTLAIITIKSKALGESTLQFIKDSPDDLITAIYSSRSETGWIKMNPVTYNGTIVVSEKKAEDQKEEKKGEETAE